MIVIHYDINKLIRKLQEYRIHYNKNYLQNSINDLNNIKNSKKMINVLKNNISQLEKNFKNIENIKLI